MDKVSDGQHHEEEEEEYGEEEEVWEWNNLGQKQSYHRTTNISSHKPPQG